jgi:ferredoxin--NADP+ reductase
MQRPAATIPDHDAFSTQTVSWIRHWNDRLFSFAVDRPASLRFRSGEFIMLGLPGESRPIMRAYSIASPAYGDEIELLSIKVEEGPLTSRLQNIVAGDQLYFGRKTTGTLVTDALRPGKRLFLLATGTGLAPFLSVVRDPESYDRFDEVVLIHSVRRVSDLAYRDLLESALADDPLLGDTARERFHYIPTVTREQFPRQDRITTMIDQGLLLAHPGAKSRLDPASDRVMMCGSMDMIRDCSAILKGLGFKEGSNANPADFVIEKAFVD